MNRHWLLALLCLFPLLLAACTTSKSRAPNTDPSMSENKRTIERYMEGFRQSNHAMVLSCLTDDVEWVIPGMFHATGKAAFDKEIENDAFVGRPIITISQLIEENDVVVAEGSVRATKRAGGDLNLVFCDVFTMRAGEVRRLVSYLTEVKAPAP